MRKISNLSVKKPAAQKFNLNLYIQYCNCGRSTSHVGFLYRGQVPLALQHLVYDTKTTQRRHFYMMMMIMMIIIITTSKLIRLDITC